MKNNKLDIFEKNAEFFERFNNSLEDTAKDRHDRTRFTVTGLENKVEFAVTNAEGRIKKAEEDAVDRLNQVNGMTNDELISESVGAGKWARETSVKPTYLKDRGIYSPSAIPPLVRGDSGVTLGRAIEGSNKGIDFTSRGLSASFFYYEVQAMFGSVEDCVTFREMRGDRVFTANKRTVEAGWVNFTELLTDKNTRTDKNNVLHSSTGTPINTLNVSDMAQEVVDRDDVTVTSGAVYRVIQELRAEIALLKGKLNE